jgi:hypothetical protein
MEQYTPGKIEISQYSDIETNFSWTLLQSRLRECARAPGK